MNVREVHVKGIIVEAEWIVRPLNGCCAHFALWTSRYAVVGPARHDEKNDRVTVEGKVHWCFVRILSMPR